MNLSATMDRLRALKKWFRDIKDARIDSYLAHCNRLVHVGANTGQEAELYARHKLDVLWIEPIPELYEKLCKRIGQFPRQRAISALVADVDGEERVLNIASNDGQSSSLFDLAKHADIWPDIHYVNRIALRTSTLDGLMSHNPGIVDALVIDTQGAELLVLKGAEQVLKGVRYVKLEAADFEAYAGAATSSDIADHLSRRSFRLVRKFRFANHPSGGGYFDLLFEKTN